MRYTDFHIHISKEEVCRLLDGEKSGLQKMLEEELEEMLPEARRRLEPASTAWRSQRGLCTAR